MANYNFAVTSTYDPFTFQELLTPYVMYKDAYEQTETAYNDLSTKADKYKYLGEQLEGQDSKAAQIYKGYADELNKQAADLAKHGLNMGNRRALTNLKRRYSGEIGRLDLANTALEEEKKLRRTMSAQDNSLLYASDNLSIDDFLDNGTPNLYNVSGNELYKRGVAAGAAASSRVYQAGDNGKTLGGYYRDWVEKNGYSKESIDAFRANAASVPELQQAVDSILEERGVLANFGEGTANRNRARQAVINGIIDGAVYQEKHNPVRDVGVMSAAETAADSRARESLALSAASSGMKKVNGKWTYDPSSDPALKKALAVAAAKNAARGGGGAAYDARNKAATVIGADSGKRYNFDDYEAGDMRALSSQDYTKLLDANGNITNEYLRSAIGNGQLSDYEIYVIPKGTSTGWFSSTDEDAYVAIPRDSKRAADSGGSSSSTGGTNDIPQ